MAPMINLRNNVYLAWSRYHGNKIVSIRQFFVNKEGDLIPTKRGISFAAKAYDELEKILFSLVLIGDGCKLDVPTPPPKEGVDTKSVIEQMAGEIRAVFETLQPHPSKTDPAAALTFA